MLSDTNQIFVQFSYNRVDDVSSNKDYNILKARYQIIDMGNNLTCGGQYNGSHGTLHSPNYPKAFPKSVECHWLIAVPPGHVVVFTLKALNLNNGQSSPTGRRSEGECREPTPVLEGALTLYDGLNQTSGILKKFCRDLNSTSQEESVRSTSRYMFVVFKGSANTDALNFDDGTLEGSQFSTGFLAEYDSGCGAQLTADATRKSIEIPRDKRNTEECDWLVAAKNPADQIYLQVNFLSFSGLLNYSHYASTRSGRKGILGGYLNIYDGSTADNRSFLGSLFSSDIPTPFVSSGNRMYIQLEKIRYAETFSTVYRNFRATYSAGTSGKSDVLVNRQVFLGGADNFVRDEEGKPIT